MNPGPGRRGKREDKEEEEEEKDDNFPAATRLLPPPRRREGDVVVVVVTVFTRPVEGLPVLGPLPPPPLLPAGEVKAP